MTCTIAMVSEEGVIMAADSAAVDGDFITQRKNSKIWRASVGSVHFLVGFCGSYSEGMYLRYGFVWPPIAKLSLETWLVTKVLPKLHKELISRFGDKREDEMNILVGFCNPGRAFMLLLPSDIEEAENFLAIGSGAMTAMGCLEGLVRVEHGTPSEQLLMALSTSEKFHTSVRGPMQIESLLNSTVCGGGAFMLDEPTEEKIKNGRRSRAAALN